MTGPYHQIAVLGTDTGVGKSWVTQCLVRGLRRAGRPVWVHKPVACGGWELGQSGNPGTAEDARYLADLVGDGQAMATLCPLQFPEPASPHLAAAAAGAHISLSQIQTALDAVGGEHDLVVEGVGGILVPITAARETIVDALADRAFHVIIVTRPDLGTLNHTALTVTVAQSRGLHIAGLVVNRAHHVEDSLATRTAVTELAACTGVPVLADIPHHANTANEAAGDDLVAALLATWSGKRQ
jgi:dethiobiotin synthetase